MAAVLRIKARAVRPVRDPSGKDASVTAIDAVAEPAGIAGTRSIRTSMLAAEIIGSVSAAGIFC